MRFMGEQLSIPPGQPPGFDRIARMFNLLEGFEIKGIEVPDPKTRRKALIDASVTAGPYVPGSVPPDVRSTFKVSIPLSLPAPEPISFLAAAGVSTLTAEADVGLRWDDSAKTVALTPATLEVAGLAAVSVKASIGNVTRDLYSPDIAKAMEVVAAADVGPIEVTVRDLGIVDLLAAEVARSQGLGPEAGRGLLAENWTRTAEPKAQLDPSLRPLLDAIGRFLQGKGETLTLRLTPKGRVRLVALVEAFRLAPDQTLVSAFNIEPGNPK
jgi:hypothetical protein